MKSLKFLFLFLVFSMLTASSTHKFYVSITKIEWVSKKSSVQIITKIFVDDMETALGKRNSRVVSLGTKRETQADRDALRNYILQKIKIEINGKPTTLKYLGQEYEKDMVVSYLEIENVKSLKSIEVENTVLIETFSEQQNIVHFKTADSRRSLILEENNPKGVINFD